MPSVCYIQVLSCRKDHDVNQSFWLLTAKLTGNLALATAHSVTDVSESPAPVRPVFTGLFLLRHAQCEFRIDTVKNNITDFQRNFRFYGKEYIVWLWEDGGWYFLGRIVPGTRFSLGCPRSAQLVVCEHQSKTFAQRGNTDDLPHAWYTCDSPMTGMFPG